MACLKKSQLRLLAALRRGLPPAVVWWLALPWHLEYSIVARFKYSDTLLGGGPSCLVTLMVLDSGRVTYLTLPQADKCQWLEFACLLVVRPASPEKLVRSALPAEPEYIYIYIGGLDNELEGLQEFDRSDPHSQ